MVERGAALRPPTFRASIAFRAGLVVCFFAAVIALPVFALPAVLFEVRLAALLAFAAFALVFAGVALDAVVFLVTRRSGRVSTCGDVSTLSVSADLSEARAASPAGPG